MKQAMPGAGLLQEGSKHKNIHERSRNHELMPHSPTGCRVCQAAVIVPRGAGAVRLRQAVGSSGAAALAAAAEDPCAAADIGCPQPCDTDAWRGGPAGVIPACMAACGMELASVPASSVVAAWAGNSAAHGADCVASPCGFAALRQRSDRAARPGHLRRSIRHGCVFRIRITYGMD